MAGQKNDKENDSMEVEVDYHPITY